MTAFTRIPADQAQALISRRYTGRLPDAEAWYFCESGDIDAIDEAQDALENGLPNPIYYFFMSDGRMHTVLVGVPLPVPEQMRMFE